MTEGEWFAEIDRLRGILVFSEAASKAERDGLTAEIERQAAEIERLRLLLKDVLDSVVWGDPPSSVKLRIEQELSC